MPSKMPIAEYNAEFFKIKVLLLVLVPGTINRNSTQAHNKQHAHTHTHTHDNGECSFLEAIATRFFIDSYVC